MLQHPWNSTDAATQAAEIRSFCFGHQMQITVPRGSGSAGDPWRLSMGLLVDITEG